MNTEMRFATVIVGAVMLAGCTTLSEGEYNNLQAVVEGSPGTKRAVVKECIEEQRALPLSEKKERAELFNINLASYPTTYCNRLWNAVANGRLTYADYRKLTMPGADSSKMIRIMQGR